ncbi:MAG: hypothetical protein HY927_11400 [Elusimicrobia bacterium]|nr:hypothetical protein [Elusimicrobiota bacterium]
MTEKTVTEQTPAAVKASERDPARVEQRRPPSRGACRRCGRNKPVNRLMLCYPCWVKTRLEEKGWREGMPHPDDCGCVGLGEHGHAPDG